MKYINGTQVKSKKEKQSETPRPRTHEKQNKPIAHIFRSDVVLEFIEASKIVKPMERKTAMDQARRYAKAVHPELFNNETKVKNEIDYQRRTVSIPRFICTKAV